MKKNIGPTLALYPTPAVVVGAFVNDRLNWILVAHIGIMGHDRVVVSMHKAHHTNKGIETSGKLSINIVDKAMLEAADYVGTVSGARTDKSNVFEYIMGSAGTPVISASPLVMECEVVDNYQTEGFDNFICKIVNTWAEEDILDTDGKIDYDVLKPILFEMPTYHYLLCGERLGKCTSYGKKLKERQAQ